jgi:hypothetical protein
VTIRIKAHSLLSPILARQANPDLYKPHRAFCSCGAWSDVMAMPTATGRANAQRNWHDEHKIAVLRKEQPWRFDDDNDSR